MAKSPSTVSSSAQAGDAAQGSWEIDDATGTQWAETPSGRDRQRGTHRADRDWGSQGCRAGETGQARKRAGRSEGSNGRNHSRGTQRDSTSCGGEALEAINVDQLSHGILESLNGQVADTMQGDCVFINCSMHPPLDDEFRVVIEHIKRDDGSKHLIVILETNGGFMETVERLVAVMRMHYEKVSFVIPNYAYSAGTVLALSGDSIFMDYYSVLGPIDPQYNSDGQFLPGHGYLAKFNEMLAVINSSASPDECRAEIAYLVRKSDPALPFHIGQGVDHGISPISEWLPEFKFKDWKKTATEGKPVTAAMRKRRAKAIAKTLGDAEKWHSHGRGISMKTLSGTDIKLLIDDFGADPALGEKIRNCHGLAVDYFSRKQRMGGYIHSRSGVRRVL